jgi:hypothetical protein
MMLIVLFVSSTDVRGAQRTASRWQSGLNIARNVHSSNAKDAES